MTKFVSREQVERLSAADLQEVAKVLEIETGYKENHDFIATTCVEVLDGIKKLLGDLGLEDCQFQYSGDRVYSLVVKTTKPRSELVSQIHHRISSDLNYTARATKRLALVMPKLNL